MKTILHYYSGQVIPKTIDPKFTLKTEYELPRISRILINVIEAVLFFVDAEEFVWVIDLFLQINENFCVSMSNTCFFFLHQLAWLTATNGLPPLMLNIVRCHRSSMTADDAQFERNVRPLQLISQIVAKRRNSILQQESNALLSEFYVLVMLVCCNFHPRFHSIFCQSQSLEC
jgi:hypothetical protein